MNRRHGIRMMLCGTALIALLLWRTQHDGFLRYGLPALTGFVWLGLAIMVWQRRLLRCGVLVLPLLLAAPLLLPVKPIDQSRLRVRYLESLRSCEGASYVWGGENRRGIDCSGLPRWALRRALAEQAVQGNGSAARSWLEQWWYDTSAKAMAESYRGFTRPLGITGNLREIDPSCLEKGDLAVTDDRRHVLIYLGAGEWIQAEPTLGRVFTARAGSELSIWLASDVSLHRWSLLTDQG